MPQLRFSRIAALALLATAACSALSTEPGRRPTELQLDSSLVTVTQGSAVSLGVRVLDQDGRPIEIPVWAAPVWTSSDSDILGVSGSALQTREPGQATATVSVAGLTADAVIRINPTEITVQLDSVALLQDGHGGALSAGRDATLRMFLVADRPNFFQPDVHVIIRRDTETVATLDASAPGVSIPRAVNDSAWTVTVPGALVQPGNSFEVRADEGRALPLTAESRSRYPAAGSTPMRFQITLRIAGAYLTQSIQRFDGSVPLVAGRDALLRVFLVADGDNAVRPMVRATFSNGGVVIRTVVLERETSSVPLAVDEGTLSSSWNARIPGALLDPGVSLTLRADPDRTLNLTPASRTDTVIALDARAVPTLWLRFIPIYLARYASTGQLDATNENAFLEPTLAMYPIEDVDADIRSAYVTSIDPATETGWNQLLSEIEALRVADSSDRYYYGVFTNPGGTDISGIGDIGWPVSIGYDNANDGPLTMAHELGHNFGRLHAPCGNPAGPDRFFPYDDGGIGAWGYDLYSNELRDPGVYKDLMSYCVPEWISDYTYEGVLAYRERWDWTTTGPNRSSDREPALLIWGRVQNGQPVLEPAFDLDMHPAVPDGNGPYRIEGYDDGEALLFSYAFTPRATDHAVNGDDATFAYAIPDRLAHTDRLQRLALVGPGGTARQIRAVNVAPVIAAERGAAGQVVVTWATDRHPMALVRDARGQILSFARGGRVDIPGQNRIEVLLSDGVSTVRTDIDRQP